VDYHAQVAAVIPSGKLGPMGFRAEVPANVRAGLMPLPGSGIEAQAIGRRYATAFANARCVVLSGDQPHEARVKAELAKRWRYVHLSTHGFLGLPSQVARLKAMLHAEQRKSPFLRQLSVDEREVVNLLPELRCGVVLAGFQKPPQPAADGWVLEDGILTGEEVSGLDLRGTDLVTLAACQTGVGTHRTGVGVLGLQRAFATAGAKTLVATLWRVDDAASSVLMERFYSHLWPKGGKDPLGKLEALRQAQLDVLNHPEWVRHRRDELRKQLGPRGWKLRKPKPLPPGEKPPPRSPPADWAGFVLSGDWR